MFSLTLNCVSYSGVKHAKFVSFIKFPNSDEEENRYLMKMSKQIKIGFIGFGKVASELSKGFQGSGLFEIWVYDKIVLDPVKKAKLKKEPEN